MSKLAHSNDETMLEIERDRALRDGIEVTPEWATGKCFSEGCQHMVKTGKQCGPSCVDVEQVKP